MQVSVENSGPLERRMTVEVPAERLDQEVENRLKSMARTARIAGFRPGKVPFKVVRQRYGRQVQMEVASELMNSSFQEALNQEGLRPAGGPRIEPGEIEPGRNLEFTAVFEVYPEFSLAPLEDIEIEKPVTEISDADIDAMLDKLRRQRATWEPVERGAEQGDQVVVDFKGTLDGEPFEGGEGSDMTVELGSGRMIAGFEEGLVGLSPGDEKQLDLTFPEDYHSEALAGKAVKFDVKVKQVSASKLPGIDEDFAASLGVTEGGIEALREEVRKNMERELENARKAVLKDRAFEALIEKNPIEVPAALVEEEVDRLAQDMQNQLGQNQNLNLPRELFQDKARRRVLLGLLIGEVVKANNIQVDQDRMRTLVENIAAGYEDPEEVLKWYYGNQEAMASVQTLVLEEQVMDWILDQAKITEKPYTFEELIELRQAANS
ncbi:trigger factor [Thiohalobacter thiocyanaticus]|uniref:Trigger factor n=1 Tax=Thiohalobacter thiocyanaticus TaxID=585455 RepID=A0A426QGE9_9GAMM|nr:trigger factor [Thiohalobacter thiocyanaticus]RRQ20831.1 trigger factor [Thiohalobacter thiocyanaticus]